MQVGVLGPAQVHRGSTRVDLGPRKQRALLAALALHVDRPVSVDTIVDLLWGDDPPAAVTATLQAYVAGLRKVLEPDRPPRAPAERLVTLGPGYALRIRPDQLDAVRFAATVTAQHRGLAPVSALVPTRARPGLGGLDLADVVAELDAVLDLWRGEPYVELDDAAAARSERTRLGELRLIALEDRALTRLWLGEQATVAAELESLAADFPLRERLWGLLALALTRSGRQADALAALRTVREVLSDELGLEPSAELQQLQLAVLRQDPALAWMPATPSGPRTVTPPASWPLVGREAPLARLTAALDVARTGELVFATVVGEPGIGKTRLASELAGVAARRDVTVLTARCSQDDGAPPLWPWIVALRALDLPLPLGDADEGWTSPFAVRQQIVDLLFGAAGRQPLLLVLDDLQWADVSSLRVLRLLAETDRAGRLMVLLTWRSHPPPADALADLVETLARRQATSIALGGLSIDQAAELVATVVEARPTAREAEALWQRTDGNPFFLVEYGRLTTDPGDLGRLLAEDEPPTAVHDVLVRRLDRLPQPTRTLLRLASVVGRQFELRTLAAASGLTDDAVLDALEPAREVGLVREEGVDRFLFAHALVRDTAYRQVSLSRRARLHAQVAATWPAGAGQETELARHWLAAGPAYADRAWRAAVAAARAARAVHAHERSAEFLVAALDTMTADPDARPRERYDVLMLLVDAYRWSGMGPELIRTVEQAVVLGEEIGDVELVARAATAPTMSTIWQSARHGEIHSGVVEALRRSLTRLPTADSASRCRVMLSLANELYYGATVAERTALVEQGLAMAERLGDDRLLLDANVVAFSALWFPATAHLRLGLAERAVQLADLLRHEQAFVVATTLRAVVEAELGMVEAMWESVASARAEARRLHLAYSMFVLEALTLPWLAMAGRFDECDVSIARIERLDAQMSLGQARDATAGAQLTVAIWRGRTAELERVLTELVEGPMPVTSTVISTLLRVGQDERAAQLYARQPIDLTPEDWLSMLNWCMAAEVAAAMHDRPLGSAVYARLAPYAGRSCCAGSSNASGPVDAFLALAAAAVGERALAGSHADRAEALIERWGIPLAAQWLGRQRVRHGF